MRVTKRTVCGNVSAIVFVGILIAASGLVAGLAGPAQAQWAPAKWRPIEQPLQTQGKMHPGGIMEIDLPRTDLNVLVHGVLIRPSFDETDIRFMGTAARTMAMGEIALLQEEVNPVLSRLLQRGFLVNAIHNHLLQVSPLIMYVHFSGTGSADRIGSALRYVLSASRTPLAGGGGGQGQPGQLDTRQIERIIGQLGQWSGGVFDVGVPRRETIRISTEVIPPEMGVQTELTFQPTGGGNAVATGEIVLLAGEVNPVATSLRASGIEVTALHNHMLTEEPRIFYMHFWADGNAVQIARSIRTALERTHSKL